MNRELGELIKAEIESRGGKFIIKSHSGESLYKLFINSAAKGFICGTPVVSDGETMVCTK